MRLFGFGRSKTNLLLEEKTSTPETAEFCEYDFKNTIEDSVKKQITQAQSFETFAEEGNYFDSEFNIKATAGRIKTMYIKEPWMFATGSLLTRTLMNIPLIVVDAKSNEEIKNHPLAIALNSANPIYSNLYRNWAAYQDLILGGEFFIVFDERFKTSIQVPCEQVSLNINEKTNLIDSISFNGKVIPYEQVVHVKIPNPYNPYCGLSLFIAASKPLLLERYRVEFEMAYYLKGGSSTGIIESTEEVNKGKMERLMRTFEAVYTGRRNWWRTIFLPKNTKWVSTGFNMQQMQHMEGMKNNRLTLLATLGIPPSSVGLTEDVNRATSETQERNYYDNAIIPLATFTADGWNNSHLVKNIYKGKVKIMPDFSKIEAIQGSILKKGEQSKAMEATHFIDEIRQKVWGSDPLPDGKGQRFVSEVRPANEVGQGLSLGITPVNNIVNESETVQIMSLKSQVIEDQESIEIKLSTRFGNVLELVENYVLELVENSLRKNLNVLSVLNSSELELGQKYAKNVEPILVGAMNRGFSLAEGQAKQLRDKVAQKATFNARDQQAIDALREQGKDGQKEILMKRSITNFFGFNRTSTTRIMNIISSELEAGKTNDQIAATIRESYKEKYRGQSNVITRTEVLTAVSQGYKWNHEVLKEVFTDVKKQWYHVGDGSSNEHARQNHVGFEQLGAVESDYRYDGVLAFPRDPSAPADQNINCRCSIVTVIPKDTTSNADVILDRV